MHIFKSKTPTSIKKARPRAFNIVQHAACTKQEAASATNLTYLTQCALQHVDYDDVPMRCMQTHPAREQGKLHGGGVPSLGLGFYGFMQAASLVDVIGSSKCIGVVASKHDVMCQDVTCC